MEEKIFEYKVKNLIEQKTMLAQMITVLIGGTVGLCFIEKLNELRGILITAGIFFVIIFVKSFIKTVIELNTYLYSSNKKRRNKNEF